VGYLSSGRREKKKESVDSRALRSAKPYSIWTIKGKKGWLKRMGKRQDEEHNQERQSPISGRKVRPSLSG